MRETAGSPQEARYYVQTVKDTGDSINPLRQAPAKPVQLINVLRSESREELEAKIEIILSKAVKRSQEYAEELESLNDQIIAIEKQIAEEYRKAERLMNDPEAFIEYKARKRQLSGSEQEAAKMRQYYRFLAVKPVITLGEYREVMDLIKQLKKHDKKSAAEYLEEIRKLYRSGSC